MRIGDEDELGTFIFRTTGFNSIRTLMTRMRYLHAVSGGLLAALPLELRLRGKSTTQSHRSSVFYVDLTLRPSVTLAEAINSARQERAAHEASGLKQADLDNAAREGLALGTFEESMEESVAVVEEFYPQQGLDDGGAAHAEIPSAKSLQSKLGRKAATLGSAPD